MTAALWLYREPGADSITPGELRHSIRSAFKHLGVTEVWIAGELPDWAHNVGHVPGVAETGGKFGRLFEDLLAACEHPDTPDDFVLMNDDFHALRAFEPEVEYFGELAGRLAAFPPDVKSGFRETFRQTLEWLQSHGVDAPLDYELHRPLPIRKAEAAAALRLAAEANADRQLHARTVYGALADLGGRCVADLKLYGFRSEGDSWRDLDLVSTSESAWQGSIGRWLRARTPEPSPFER